jgi:hypothetical protein
VGRRIARWLAMGLAAVGLAWADWPSQPSGPATVISRIDVIAVVALLAVLPGLVARRFGPVGESRLTRMVRLGGCTVMLALVLAKADAGRTEYARVSGSLWVAGIWTGELIFLLVLVVYLAGLLAVTARRPPATPSAIAIGTCAGVLAGLILYVLPPQGSPLRAASSWFTDLYGAGRLLAVPLVAAAAIAAGVKAARRTSRHNGKLPLHTARARQGVAAGVCAGMAAAVTVSVLGISTIALVPSDARVLEWTLPSQILPSASSVYRFEVSVTEAAAGYLLVFIFFPILGAGLGAWGGMFGSDRPGPRPGGGGGRGPRRPDVNPPPPSGGRRLDDGHPAVPDIRRILDYPPWEVPSAAPEGQPAAPGHRERVPAGRAGARRALVRGTAGLPRPGPAVSGGPARRGLRRAEPIADQRLGGANHQVQ